MTMVFADDIRRTILEIADECGTGRLFSPRDIACRVDKTCSHDVIDQVYFVASVLVREGRIDSLSEPDTSPGKPRYFKKR